MNTHFKIAVVIFVQGGLFITAAALASPYQNAVMADKPLVYYRFEDASAANGQTCADIAARAYKNGVYINKTSVDNTSNKPDIALVPGFGGLGQAAQFNGNGTGGVGNCIHIDDIWSTEYPTAIAYNTDGTPRQTLSIEFWINSINASNYPRILQHNDGTGSNKGGFGIGSHTSGYITMMGGLTSGGTTNTWYTGTGNVFDGLWHHVVATYEQVGTDLKEFVYIDGAPKWGNTVANTSLNVPVSRLTLGAEGSQWYVYNGFVGMLDEVAVYDTLLSAERIAAHYALASVIVLPYKDEVMADTPVLYLQFENVTPQDSSGNNYWVYYAGGASIQNLAGIGNAVHLNGAAGGAGGFVAAAPQTTAPGYGVYSDTFSFAPNDITFELWTKIESMTQYGMIFQQIGSYTREDYAPGIGQYTADPNLLGVFRVLNGTADANDSDFWYPGTNIPTDGGWHHLVLTYDENYNDTPNALGIQLYLDGVLANSTVYQNAKLGPELGHIVIGAEGDRGYVYNNMVGLVDEFAIYAGVLSTERIQAHYDSGLYALTPHSCPEVWRRGMGMPGDIDRNCKVDLSDFAAIASTWLLCNDPTLFESDPACTATW